MQQHADHGGVVHVRVVRVGSIGRPSRRAAARAAAPPSRRPRPAPACRGAMRRRHRSASPASAMAWPARPVSQIGDRQGWQSMPWRAGPAKARSARHQQLAHRLPGDGGVGMVRRVAQRVEHHHAVGDGGVDAAQAVVAVQPLGDERHGLADGAVAAAAGKQRLGDPQHGIDALEEPPPPGAVRSADPVAHLRPAACGTAPAPARRADCAPPGCNAISTSSGTITVRDQYDTFDRWNGNHSGRCMISSGITGTARHGTWPNKRKLRAGEDVGALGPAGVQDRRAGARHVRRVRVVADRLQRVVRLRRWPTG